MLSGGGRLNQVLSAAQREVVALKSRCSSLKKRCGVALVLNIRYDTEYCDLALIVSCWLSRDGCRSVTRIGSDGLGG